MIEEVVVFILTEKWCSIQSLHTVFMHWLNQRKKDGSNFSRLHCLETKLKYI